MLQNWLDVAHTSALRRPGKRYRRFESQALRHAVWGAENSGPPFLQNTRIMRVFCDFYSINWTGENGLRRQRMALIQPFSLKRR